MNVAAKNTVADAGRPMPVMHADSTKKGASMNIMLTPFSGHAV
jgi:hypothetical protein